MKTWLVPENNKASSAAAKNDQNHKKFHCTYMLQTWSRVGFLVMYPVPQIAVKYKRCPRARCFGACKLTLGGLNSVAGLGNQM